MKVRATKKGFMFHRRIKVGEIITLKDEKQFSDLWMVAVDGKAPAKAEAKPVEKKETKAKKEKKDDVI